ncbi:MAG: SpaH/EbpB family LPXTG-anchored major pilin [Candidatus Limivicinus sp.]
MKYVRKSLALLLALILVLALGGTAFAEGETGSITINDAVVGQTYTIYQILDLESYDASANAYSYKATTAWNTFINSSEIKGTYVEVDGQGYVTWKNGADAAAFAKAAQKYAKDNSIANQGSVTAATTPVSFTDLKLGYYLVDTTLGTLCSLDTTNPNVVMEEKNEVPANEKSVEEDSKVVTGDAWGKTNDADIGQTVNFKSVITAQAGAENYVFHDKMSTGLTYTGVTGITLNDTTVDAANYTVVTTGLTDGCTFEVRFTQAFCDTLKANDQIVVSYTATLNENAVIAGEGNPNTSKVSYGDSSNTKYTPDSQTKTYTWDVDVFKYTMNGETETALADATFTLSKNADGSSPIALVSKGNNVYRVAKTGETGTVTEITTDATGKFTIQGLDADTYYLTETAAPAGYNKLAGAVTITIGENGVVNATAEAPQGVNEVKVLNQSGTELPSTGGMGTTLFYVLGSVLVLCAVVLLVTRKRMSNKG